MILGKQVGTCYVNMTIAVVTVISKKVQTWLIWQVLYKAKSVSALKSLDSIFYEFTVQIKPLNKHENQVH